MKVEYVTVQEDLPWKESSYYRHHHPCGAGPLPWCPRLTRWRVVSVTMIITVATMMFLFECLQPAFLRTTLCCYRGQGPQTMRLPEEDYGNYSDRIRYKHTKRRLPGAIIIGVRKGGTRAMLEFLNQHPSVQAQKREMHFFDDEDNYSLGLEWYRKKMPFSFPDQTTIEKTPGYFVSELAPERVYKMNRTIRLILVVRDPTERAISDYTQIHVHKVEKKKAHESFEELAINDETGEVRQSYNAIRRSIYHRHMERWLKWFPLESFLIISGENLVKNPLAELRRVEDFLGLQHRLAADNFYWNETRGFFCINKESKAKCLAKSKGRQHPDIDANVLRKLRQFFRTHNQKFYDLVGHDFGWP